MNEEEKKAIETLKSWKDYNIRNKNKLLRADEIIKVQETILNLIEKMKICINILDDELKERDETINKKEIIIEKLQKEDTEQKSEIKKIEHDNQTLKNFASGIFNENIEKDFIPVQKVEDKISERQFELQQEYKDFEDDAILIVLQGLLKGEN